MRGHTERHAHKYTHQNHDSAGPKGMWVKRAVISVKEHLIICRSASFHCSLITNIFCVPSGNNGPMKYMTLKVKLSK